MLKQSSEPSGRIRRNLLAGAMTLAVAAGCLVPGAGAFAATPYDGVVINEAYLSGGSAGAAFKNKFVELYNGSDRDVDLTGASLQYRSATGIGSANSTVPLSGTIKAHGYYLIKANSNGASGTELPTADAEGATFAPSGTNGTLVLAAQTAALTAADLPTGSAVGGAKVIDLLGYGTSNTFETAAATAPAGNTDVRSFNRTDGVDSNDNSKDFTLSPSITPQNRAGATGGGTDPGTGGGTDPGTAPEKTIAEIQGTGAVSPLDGQTVSTKGVVTAVYATGGFNGFTIQTPGTGGAIDLAAHPASDGLFVYGAAGAASVTAGDYVQVTGKVSEYKAPDAKKPDTLTELSVATAGDVVKLNEQVAAPQPATVAFPATAAQRESLESMLLAPQGAYTVSNTYSTNAFGTVGLAVGTKPLITPTEVARPRTPAYDAAVADNEARGVVLDDGASTNYGPSGTTAAKSTPLPYLSKTKPVRVGAKATFTAPVILDYRFDTWNFQPTRPITGNSPAADVPATFENDRPAKPAEVGGDLKLATFNVLNYFTTTGDQLSGCTFYTDRAGANITVNKGCDARGAANTTNLTRQQDKIVAAINTLGADVISLEEIENSVKFGKDRDDALAKLVTALNAAAGSAVWKYVPSPAPSALPAVSAQDVIRSAFIYRAATAEPVGPSVVFDDPAFAKARQPLAQAFTPKGASAASKILVIANHFKSKSSSAGLPGDEDTGDGQGASNATRKAEAEALVGFANAQKQAQGTERVFLVGDFNAYAKEDPIAILEAAGYVNQGAKTGKYSYSFSGQSGSLDVIFASPQADAAVSGVDIWNINAPEAIALEYSRYNYNVTDFYDASAYRSSDHDPVIVGVASAPASDTVKINLLNINDFHGRIEANTTSQFAGTIEQLRAQEGEANTLFLSDGDNIGASLFASSLQKDQPTIDVLNALDLRASAVGNHEFDGGFGDLTDRVIGAGGSRNAKWDYLGANVYKKGTTTPALPEYSIQDVDGVKVAVIGAVTEETPTLVSPAGVKDLDFGDPVAAVNRVAARLTDGDPSNGEAQVLIAEYHEGAGAGLKEGATLEQELAAGGVFAKIVNQTSPKVAAIFTGHTHKEYAWNAAITGADGKRSVLQTGNYGENVGQNVLTVERATGKVLSYTSRNVPRTTASEASLVSQFPRVAEVKRIVDAALAQASVEGSKVVGSLTAAITTAHTGGAYGPDGYGGASAKRDDRANQSALGSLVADSMVESLKDADRGGAQIGINNPGGLRAELPKGNVTFAQANAVLPFANNLWTTTLSGAALKEVLEQQWQRDGNGNVPSRPFLALSVSKNVRYTFDSTRPEGDRITGIWVNGARVTAGDTFRTAAPSFLIEGGDNFRAFTKGTQKRDSGLVDRDAWMSYLTAHQNLSPDFAKRGVEVQGAPAAAVRQGERVSFRIGDVDGQNTRTLGGLDLTSLGSPRNTAVTVSFRGSSAAPLTVPVVDGRASVAVEVPGDVSGEVAVTLTAAESGTTVTVPVTVTPPVATATTLAVTASGSKRTLTATVSPSAAGSVEFFEGATRLGTAPVDVASGTAMLSRPFPVGAHTVTARFVPADPAETSASASAALKFTVAKLNTVVKAKVKVNAAKGRKLKIGVSLTGTNLKPAPMTVKVNVKVRGASKSYAVKLRGGSAVLKLGSAGSKFARGAKATVTVTVPASSVSSSTTVYAFAKTTARFSLRLK